MSVWAQKQRGFTLVELLIVIVVIAILAAITIVAYNGVQDRARNAALQQALVTVEQAAKLYYEEHGSFPAPTDVNAGAPGTEVCVGNVEDYTASNGFSVGQCTTAPISAPTPDIVSSVIVSALHQYISPLPKTSQYITKLGSVSIRGVLYRYTSGSQITLAYIANGNQDCGHTTKTQGTIDGALFTQCSLLIIMS